jgi:predicted metalloprotease with PDZ domain
MPTFAFLPPRGLGFLLLAAAGACHAAPAIELSVDATDVAHRLLQVHERIALAPGTGRMVLHYPQFQPGAHGPYGDVSRFAGLVIEADGQRLAWQRDTADAYAYGVEVPAGAKALDLRFQYIAPAHRGTERISITRRLLGIEWDSVALYPAGQAAADLRVQASARLPPGWQAATALRSVDGSLAVAGADGWYRFAETSFETLVDSPLMAGASGLRVILDTGGASRPVAMHMLADEASQLKATPAQLDAHRQLVHQADLLFGSRPFRHYDFLLALSDEMGGLGLEHHESSENSADADYFDDWDKSIHDRELLPHEYVHAWNGKFRRPADLWTPHYNTPMRNSQLWVYEGLTEYWGHVLAARSGLSTPEQARDRLATSVAGLQTRAGRRWRNLQDTTLQATVGPGHTPDWEDWQRGADYYEEGLLIWLDADTLIRERSGNKRSLDDFARSFFGRPAAQAADGAIQPLTYTFEELVSALNALEPFDWRAFFRARLDSTEPGGPLDGVTRSGWRLAWSDTESAFAANEHGSSGPDGNERPQDLAHSLGLRITSDGKLDQVLWDSPAFKAGLSPGMTLLAVNDRAYKAERLAAAVTANRGGQAPLALLLRDGDLYFTARIDWQGGLRYPRLERIPAAPDRLTTIYKAR